MLDFESMLYNYFHFSNYLVMASDYITFNVQIKQIKCFVTVQMTWEPKISLL